MAGFTRNFVSYYSAPTNGTSDCRTAWNNFRNDCHAVSDPVNDLCVLQIPNAANGGSNTYQFNNSSAGGDPLYPGAYYMVGGCRRARIEGLTGGGTRPTIVVGADGAHLACGMAMISGNTGDYSADPYGNNWVALLETVYAGSTTLQCKVPATAGLFSANSWHCLTGIDITGYGSPPNEGLWDWVYVTGVNTSTGVITIDPTTPPSCTYKSNWPKYWDGHGTPGSTPVPFYTHDQGGPAQLYKYSSDWDTEVEFKDLILSNTANIMSATGKQRVFRNVDLVGGSTSIWPTQNKLFHVIGGNWQNSTELEMDKQCDTVLFENSLQHQTYGQSPSPKNFILRGTTSFDTQITGVSTNFRMEAGTSVGILHLGTVGYGSNETTYIAGNVTTLYTNGGVFDSAGGAGIANTYTLTNGVIRIPIPADPAVSFPFWAIPGRWMFLGGASWTNSGMPFQVQDVRSDGTYWYVRTNLTRTGWPTGDITGFNLHTHPGTIAVTTAATGAYNLRAIRDALGPEEPVNSRSKFIYNAANNSFTNISLLGVEHWGYLRSITATVTKVYSGTSPTLYWKFSQFTNYPTVNQTTFARVNYGFDIDLKTLGTYTATPTTGTVAMRTSDWFSGAYSPYLSADISGESTSVWPEITFELVTDQGYTPLRTYRSIEIHGGTYRNA